MNAHRISAHRSLNLNPAVAKISEEKAQKGLLTGYPEVKPGAETNYRASQRWGSKSSTNLLNDYDYLLQLLFANQSNVALRTHYAVHANKISELEETYFQKLSRIWDGIFPHRKLYVTGDGIRCLDANQNQFDGSEMSDGERSAFYLIGQVLVAMPNVVLIFDEPELHMHRSILGSLWDEVEAARPDCAFLVITHDLEFAASRPGRKYVIKKYMAPSNWEVEEVPDGTGFSEEVSTLILGSRKPILFVEGTDSSLDLAVYRACYPSWTVIPRGNAADVIHSVATMRANSALTRVTCAGAVDADDHNEDEIRALDFLGVAVLPVCEIENLFLLPQVVEAMLEMESFDADERVSKHYELRREMFALASAQDALESVAVRHCQRRIDRALKSIDLRSFKTSGQLKEAFLSEVSQIDVEAIVRGVMENISDAMQKDDSTTFLRYYDNKALLNVVARKVKGLSKSAFEDWISRSLRDPKNVGLRSAVQSVLPALIAK